MNTIYDESFMRIKTYQIHPGFLPFVGEKYEIYQVLHVGESHYINNDNYDIEYFANWFDSPCKKVEQEFSESFTRPVMKKYMNNVSGSYTIFSNFLKSFCRSVMNEEITINPDTKKRYEYLAFMNFFQMPSLFYGIKYWESLLISAKRKNNKQLAYDMWEDACKNAVETLDSVIDIIQPKAVVITSLSAGDAYKEYGGKYKDSIIFTSHPAYPFTWHKDLKGLDGKKGIDVCEEGLRAIFGGESV